MKSQQKSNEKVTYRYLYDRGFREMLRGKNHFMERQTAGFEGKTELYVLDRRLIKYVPLRGW